MSTINFSHLKLLAVFACVVESGSFASAARKLGSSRSRISEQVSLLEQSVGVRLIQRSTRQLNITPEGLEVYEQARILPDTLKAVEAIAQPSKPSGRVAITMNHDIAHRFIVSKLKAFQLRYPDIQLDLILDDSRLDLISEQIDLGIRIGFPKDDSLIARALHQDKFGLFTSPLFLQEHNLESIDSIEQLEALQWITLKHSSYHDVFYMEQDGKSIEIKPKHFYKCNSPLMMKKMVAQGLGIAQLLPSTLPDELERGEIIRVMPDVNSLPINFALVYPSRKQVPMRTRVLIDYLLEVGVVN